MTTHLFFAEAVSAVLVSWWKMVLMLLPFVGWAWLVATKLDKDARYFHLNHRAWNGVHMAAGAAALAAMLFIPYFIVSWPVGVMILAGPVLAYWYTRNQAVPEEKRFKLTGEGLSTKITQKKLARAAKHALLQFTDSKGQTRQTPLRDDPLFEIHGLAEDIIGPAIAARASRLKIEVGQNGGVIEQTIDGVRYKRPETIPTETAVRLIDFLKDIGGLDVADRRRRQSGEFKVHGSGDTTEVAIATAGTSTTQSLRLDFDRAKRLHKPFDGLGLLEPQLTALREFEQLHERHGIILIGAPPGHGLTTSAYSFLGRHDAYTSNVKSLEREIQVQLLGVDQIQWDPSNPDIDYATNLQSILRRDPDIVLTAEIKDSETARVAADPGMKGPLIYIQQALPTIEDQIRDWVKKVGDLKQATRALRAVTNQRLVRSLCPNCRQPYQATPELLKKLNIPAKQVTQLYRAGGKVQVKNKIEDCPVCGGTGYLGQTGAFEVMIIDDECRKLLAAADLKGARAHARRNKMIYLQEAALMKVVAGETTIEEVSRVLSPQAAGGSDGAAARPTPSSSGSSAQPTPAR